ncbi:MAG: YeeE/YedE thiosulfate transporter family protein [Burkholderiaceae bacterium]
MLLNPAIWIAALAAGIMGFAIQRGATCTVAAVDEALSKRRATRLLAMLEAAAWVAVGLWLAQQFGWLAKMPSGYALSGWTVLGAALLGLGAFVNRACVFGAIARLGSGEWAYIASPLGFFAGCLSLPVLFSPPPAVVLAGDSIALAMMSALVAPLFLFLALRLVLPLVRTPIAQWPAALTWSPRSATIVIGIAFLITLLLAGGTWAYTDMLAELASKMAASLDAQVLLALALFLGAMMGGWTAGRLRFVPVSAVAVLRCFAGGMLMAWGSLLIPGSNDGLILVGIPLLWPYAIVGFAVMCVTIAGAQVLQRRLSTAAISPSELKKLKQL